MQKFTICHFNMNAYHMSHMCCDLRVEKAKERRKISVIMKTCKF